MVKTLLSLILMLAGMLLPAGSAIAEGEAEDALAGTSIRFLVPPDISSGERFTLAIRPPRGKKVVMIPGRGGDLEVEANGEHFTVAGRYTYQFLGKAGGEVTSGEFRIFSGPPERFSFVLDSENDREKVFKVKVTDAYGNGVPGRPLLVLDAAGTKAERLTGATGEDGIARFLVTTSEPSGAYTVIDTLSELSETHEVAFEDLPTYGKAGGPIRASLLDEFEREEDEKDGSERYGYVDHFDVRVRQDQVERKIVAMNKQLDLVITALDEEDRRVKDYVGDVVIETTDPNALAPLRSLRFLPSHKGLLERDLALMLSTTGLQVVRAYDQDAPEIEGSLEVQVVGSDRSIERGSITIESPKDGSVGEKVEVRGNTDAYINLEATDNDTVVWTGDSDAEGKFSFSLTLDPKVPTHTIVVREGEGGLGRVSKPLLLTVDTSAPQLRSDTLALLPERVAPGGSVTVSIVAEAKHAVAASLASASEVPLTESQTVVEEGWSTYEATLTAGAQAGSVPVTVLIRDAAGNTSRATKTLVVSEAGLPTVQGLQAQILANGIQLVWLPTPGASSYRIYVGLSPNDLSNHIDMDSTRSPQAGSTATSVRLTGLSPGQTYYVAVTALGAEGLESAEKSELVSIQTQGSLFQTRIFPIINGARVEWVKPAQADVVAYRLQYGVQPGRMYTEQRLIDPQSTRFEMPDLINGVPYYVSLSALLRDGKLLEDTAEVSVTPGEGGKPGMHLAPPDPLPAGTTSSGWPEDLTRRFLGMEEGREEDAVVSGSEQHRSAPSLKQPPRTPRSGSPVLWGAGILSLAAGSSLVLFLQSRRKEQRLLATIQQHYAAYDR